jgi:hypothetical protein
MRAHKIAVEEFCLPSDPLVFIEFPKEEMLQEHRTDHEPSQNLSHFFQNIVEPCLSKILVNPNRM